MFPDSFSIRILASSFAKLSLVFDWNEVGGGAAIRQHAKITGGYKSVAEN